MFTYNFFMRGKDTSPPTNNLIPYTLSTHAVSYILCVVEYLEDGLHALVSDGWPCHGVEHFVERSKESLNKHIAQGWVFTYSHQSGIILHCIYMYMYR